MAMKAAVDFSVDLGSYDGMV